MKNKIKENSENHKKEVKNLEGNEKALKDQTNELNKQIKEFAK